MQLFDKARQLADESTGLPFAHGQTGVQVQEELHQYLMNEEV